MTVHGTIDIMDPRPKSYSEALEANSQSHSSFEFFEYSEFPVSGAVDTGRSEVTMQPCKASSRCASRACHMHRRPLRLSRRDVSAKANMNQFRVCAARSPQCRCRPCTAAQSYFRSEHFVLNPLHGGGCLMLHGFAGVRAPTSPYQTLVGCDTQC